MLLQVRVTQDGLALSGELDMASVDDFQQVTARGIDDSREIVLDLSGLTYMDVTGLRSIVRLASECLHGVVLRYPQRIVEKVFDIVRMEELPGLRVQRREAGNPSALGGSDIGG